MAAQIENHPFEGARFKISRKRRSGGASITYVATERERDAVLSSIEEIFGKRCSVLVEDLEED